MKYLIIGLGNIGTEYHETRHNIGFMVLDKMAKQKEVSFEQDRYAYKAEIKQKGRSFHLIKPTTYMNLSGKAVRYWMKELNIPVENILVITDDLSLPHGKLRMKPKGSNGGHNGLGNIQELLSTTVYPRLRFGVGDDFSKGKQIDYVLGKFSEDQQIDLELHIDKAIQMVYDFGFIGVQKTMNAHN